MLLQIGWIVPAGAKWPAFLYQISYIVYHIRLQASGRSSVAISVVPLSYSTPFALEGHFKNSSSAKGGSYVRHGVHDSSVLGIYTFEFCNVSVILL